MSDPERLKALLAEAKDEVGKMDAWMKTQEPAPGDSYEDWMCNTEKRDELPGKSSYMV
jgi:hypothetical protein